MGKVEVGHLKAIFLYSEEEKMVGDSHCHNIQVSRFEVQRTACDLTDLQALSVVLDLVLVHLLFLTLPNVQALSFKVPH